VSYSGYFSVECLRKAPPYHPRLLSWLLNRNCALSDTENNNPIRKVEKNQFTFITFFLIIKHNNTRGGVIFNYSPYAGITLFRCLTGGVGHRTVNGFDLSLDFKPSRKQPHKFKVQQSTP
jgi:hypothetical protein